MIAARPIFGDIKRYTRRPRNFDEMERQGWHFISEKCIWDGADIKQLVQLLNDIKERTTA